MLGLIFLYLIMMSLAINPCPEAKDIEEWQDY